MDFCQGDDVIVLMEPYGITRLRPVSILAGSPDTGLPRREGVIEPAQLIGREFAILAEVHGSPDCSFPVTLASLVPSCRHHYYCHKFSIVVPNVVDHALTVNAAVHEAGGGIADHQLP